MKKYQGKIIIFLILGVFLIGSGLVLAQDNQASTTDNSPEVQALNKQIQDNQTQLDSLKKTVDEYIQKIEDYKKQSANLKNQLGLIDNQIIKVGLDVKTTQLQIDKTQLQISALDYQISKKEAEIAKDKQNLIIYLQQIAQNDQKSYLEILIANDSLAGFFSQITYLEQIQADIQNTVNHLKIAKDAAKVQKSDLEKQKQDLQKLKADLLVRQDKLSLEQGAKELVLTQSKNTEIQFQQMLQQARQRQAKIDSDVLALQKQLKDKILKIKKEGSTSQTTLLNWPVPSHEITAYFHDPDYPFRYIYEHPAIDIRAKQGTPIRAPADGYVARAVNAGYGYSYIIIIHDNGLSTVYGHVSAIYVKVDNYVKAGDIIGLSGGMPGTRGAGNMTVGPHLHFEVRLNGIPVNPLEYLP